MSPIVVAALVALNLVVIFLLLAVPIGIRTIAVRARIAAPRMRLWQALYPLGDDAAWSGEILSAEPIGEGGSLARIRLSWEGRDGRPIERKVRLSDVVEGERYAMRVEDDSSLDPAFGPTTAKTVRSVRSMAQASSPCGAPIAIADWPFRCSASS